MRPDVANLEDVTRHLEDGAVRKEGAMVVDGDTLEHLLHVDGLAAIVERALLPLLHAAPVLHALLERVVPSEVGVPRQQRVDDGPRPRAVELADDLQALLVGCLLHRCGFMLRLRPLRLQRSRTTSVGQGGNGSLRLSALRSTCRHPVLKATTPSATPSATPCPTPSCHSPCSSRCWCRGSLLA